jgi:uncharacterized protein YbjT (DUF2867 family)
MQSRKTAIIAGASGLVGSHLLHLMLSSKKFDKVVALVRTPLEINHPDFEQIVFDFDNETDYKNLPEAHSVYCCLGTTIKKAGGKDNFIKVDYTYPLKLATHCHKKGTKAFYIVTALGSNAKSVVFYNQVKGKVEDDIKNLNFESLHIFRPSLLLGKRNEVRPAEKAGEIMLDILKPFMRGKLKKYAAIKAEDVAGAMLKADNKGINIYLSDEIQNMALSRNL